MPEFIRVRDKDTKHEYSVGVVDPAAHDVLNESATDPTGGPLPPKHHLTPTQKKAIEAAESDTTGASK